MIESIETIEVTNQLVINHRVRQFCKLPYPNHKKGCPNYEKKTECPPEAPLIEDFLDLSQPHHFIIVKFNLKSHIQRMKSKHPNWTIKQCRCVLYYQNTIRKALRDEIKKFTKSNSNLVSTLLPEAMGVYVIKTVKKLGIPIQSKPIDTVFKIALIGYPKNPIFNKKPQFSKNCGFCYKY